MKTIFFIFFATIAISTFGQVQLGIKNSSGNSGTSYYVSNYGNDSDNGLTPATAWKTIAKVNASTFPAGSKILFKKGDVWRETLTVPSSGTASKYITISSYGTGAKPQILGSTKLTEWTSGSIGGVASNNDILAESFEGAGYQNSWTEYIGANNSIVDQDNTETTPVGGSQVLKLQKIATPTATNAASAMRTTTALATEAPITYMDYYVRINAHSLASGSMEKLNYNTNANGDNVTQLLLRNLSGSLKLYPQIVSDGSGQTYQGAAFPASGNLNLDQWYRVQFLYDYTHMLYECTIDGTIVLSGSLTGTPYTGIKNIWFGNADSTVPFTAYVDLVNISSTNFYSEGIALPSNVWASNVSITDPWSLVYKGNCYFLEINGSVSWGRVKKMLTSDLAQEYDWTVSAGKLCIYSPTDPNLRYSGVEIAQRVKCVSLNDKNYIRIDGLEIAYPGSYGISDLSEINMTGLIIKNCHIHHIGIKSSLAGYGIEQCHSNALIRNNVIHDSGRRNISLDLYGDNAQVSNITIEDNTLYNGFHTTGVDINSQAASSLTNVIIRRNLIYNELTGAIDGVENFGSVFIYISRDGSGDVGNIHIYNNIFKNVTSGAINFGAGVGGSSSTYIYNNTFYGVSDYITSDYAAMFLIQKGSSAVFKNNIFYNNAKLSVTTLFSVFNIQSDAGTIVLDNNLYYNTEANRWIAWRGTNYSISQLSTFRTATNQELNGIVGQNPNFVSFADFHLQSGSPAVDTGMTVGLTIDYEINPITGIPDIGAFEKQ